MAFIAKPFLDGGPTLALRDPAVIYHDGIYHCFHTRVEINPSGYSLSLGVTQSSDLTHWSPSRAFAVSPLNFSSPGNIIRHDNRWILCLQSYPITPGESYGNEESRLWLMESADLVTWSEPRSMQPAGCQAAWAKSRRQIDPFLVNHEEQFWCFYKTEGQLGLLVSEDLHTWREASPDRPVMGLCDNPDGAALENPCVIRAGGEFVLFWSPCRTGRGIGIARSTDLLNWCGAQYLDFPALPWSGGGPTAAMVLDTREQVDCWTLFFHGDRVGPHDAALGLAFSDDLYTWRPQAAVPVPPT